MSRDNGEQQTRPDGVDIDSLTGIDDPAEPDYRDDRPQVVPDRPQPRYRPQTTDAFGHARRRNDPFQGCRDEPPTYGDDPKKFAAWKQLMERLQKQLQAIAEQHAARLRNYREDRVADLIDREIEPAVRKLVRGVRVVPPEMVDGLVVDFVERVWSEIERMNEI